VPAAAGRPDRGTQVQAEPAGTRPAPPGVARIMYFDYDSYTIKPEFQSFIEAHARFLKANPAAAS
jgi:peptidoglycan-associated lipoprotein